MNFKDLSFEDCGTAMDVAHGSQFNIDGAKFIRVGQGIVFRDPPSFLQNMGLPANTPHEFVLELIEKLQQSAGMPTEQRVEQLRGSRLDSFLGSGEKLADFGTKVITFISTLSDQLPGAGP